MNIFARFFHPLIVTTLVTASAVFLFEAFAGISVRIQTGEPSAMPSSQTTPAGSAMLPSGSPLPSTEGPILQSEAAQIRRAFARAAADELKALKHRQKSEFSELKASQKARLREWDTREREARKKFFTENRKGAERRAYVQDFIARRKALLALFADERAARTREQVARLASAQDEVAAKTKELELLLSRNERPSATFWPRFQ